MALGDGQGDAPRARRPGFLRPFRTPLRGHAFASPPDDAPPLAVDDPVTLRREPGNPADPLAVAVWTATTGVPAWRVGYLDRGVAARLAPRMDDGLEVSGRLTGWVAEPRGRWRRPLVRIETVGGPAVGPDATPLASIAGEGTSEVTFSRLRRRPPGVRRRTLGRRADTGRSDADPTPRA